MKNPYLEMIKNLLCQATGGMPIKKIYEAHSREDEVIFDTDMGMIAISIRDGIDSYYYGLRWLVCRLHGL